MGLLLTVPPLGMSVLAPLAGSLSDRYGYSRLTSAGLWVRAAAFLVFLGLGPHTRLPWLVLGLALLGAGGALFNPPNTSSIMGSVGPERLGTAGGIAAVARNLGMALGIATGGAAFSLAAGAAGGADLAALAPGQAGAFTAGWRTAMGVGLVLCLTAVAVSARRRRQPAGTSG